MVKLKNKKGNFVRLVEMNNKSRQGLYAYFKEPGKHGRYYKFTGTPEELSAYRKQYKTGKRLTAKRYLQKIKKQPSISKAIKKGITTATIKDVNSVTISELTKAKEKLLRPLIKDKEILKIMVKDENFNKLKNRLDYRD